MKYSRSIVITHPYGIHARPSAYLSEISQQFKSDICIKYNGKQTSTENILGLLSLGVQVGETIEIEGDGEDAKEAVEGLLALVRSNFGLSDPI